MIGGINSNGYGPLQPDRPIPRDDSARQENRSNSGNVYDADMPVRRDTVDPQLLERRVQARQAAQDAQLERFRADDIPRRNAEALEVFTGIASQRDGSDVELAGIDIRV